MPVQAVFFDMGETLCYQNPPTPKVLGDFLSEQGFDVTEQALRSAYLAAMTYFSSWAMAVDMNQRTAERREEMIAEFYRVMMRNLGLGDRLALIPAARETMMERRNGRFNALFDDVIPALDALRALGVRLGIVSNWDETLAETVHELGLTPYFEAVVASANVGVEKPNPEIFRYAMDRLAVAPEAACHVGDIYYMDVLGARGAGVNPVLLDRHGLQRRVDCLRIESLNDLPATLKELNR